MYTSNALSGTYFFSVAGYGLLASFTALKTHTHTHTHTHARTRAHTHTIYIHTNIFERSIFSGDLCKQACERIT